MNRITINFLLIIISKKILTFISLPIINSKISNNRIIKKNKLLNVNISHNYRKMIIIQNIIIFNNIIQKNNNNYLYNRLIMIMISIIAIKFFRIINKMNILLEIVNIFSLKINNNNLPNNSQIISFNYHLILYTFLTIIANNLSS